MIQEAFAIEIRDLKILATSKCKKIVVKTFGDLRDLFKKEYAELVIQYNKMKYTLHVIEQE